MTTEAQALDRPDWLAAEMPPGYRNRLEEMRRLQHELDELMRFGRLLCDTGNGLCDAVRETLLALDFEAMPGPRSSSIVVKLEMGRRLLIHVSASDQVVQRRSADLANVFQVIHEDAANGDRVVLVANHKPATRPTDRGDGVDDEAASLLKRLGANYVAGSTMFLLWSFSLQDRARAREMIDRLHTQDGGVFLLPAPVAV